jgi:hypothetical protein
MLGDMRIVLDCKVENVQEILKQAQQVGIMTAYHSYFVTNLVRLVSAVLTTAVTDKNWGGFEVYGHITFQSYQL